MQRFKSIILSMQGKNKSNLHWLYNTSSDIEPLKIFSYCSMRFWFNGTSYRNSEKLLLYVEIPTSFTSDLYEPGFIPLENYLLCVLSPVINNLSHEYVNTDKNVREKAQFAAQATDEIMIRKSGIYYDFEKGSVVLTIHFNVPLVNALSVNAKSAIHAVKDILDHINNAIETIDLKKLNQYCSVYKKQQEIRVFLKSNNYCAFIADGSILPRENGTEKPMKNAVPFVSPEDMRVTVSFTDGTSLSGMGIKRGVTVITGGGYSGKSTVLDAIEMGIYNHIPGDGREYVITDDTALKIGAEDGRPVYSLDLSPFFRFLPGDGSARNFSTLHASGSVSQAANIVEAVYGGSKLILIDEDKSATNFMIRDLNMRKIVKNEPIIPFTDRVRELYSEKSVSTILVIGGSSEYLTYADSVILMNDYVPENITEKIKTLDLPAQKTEKIPAFFTESRVLVPRATSQPFLYFRNVETENEKKIILDEYSSDITHLTAIVNVQQMNMLSIIVEQLLCDKESNNDELICKIRLLCETCMEKRFENVSLLPDTDRRWYEAIRPLDAFCCINRMRGITFAKIKDS